MHAVPHLHRVPKSRALENGFEGISSNNWLRSGVRAKGRRLRAFLLLLCTEANALKWRFPQEIATLLKNKNGYISRRNTLIRQQEAIPVQNPACYPLLPVFP